MPWNHLIWHVAVVTGCLLNYAGLWELLRERLARRS